MKLRSISALAVSLVLSACGKDSSGNAALDKSFTYGAAQAPTATEAAAASDAQDSIGGATTFSTSPDAAKGMALASMASGLGAALLGETAFASAAIGPALAQRVRQAADLATCATVTATSVTFKDCVVDDSGYAMTINGSVTGSTGKVTWDLTGNFSGSIMGATFNITSHPAGTITVAANEITGNSTDEVSGTVSGQGQSVSFGVAHAVVLDLTYQSTPTACVTAGSVEVKRVWTEKPKGATGAAYNDAGVKMTWAACGTVQVAHSI